MLSDKMRLYGVIVFLSFLDLAYPFSNGMQDYCAGETFEASCPGNKVIVMWHALYGTMRLGKCVNMDLGYIGCSSDVLHIMDRICSGRRKCTVLDVGAMFNETTHCPGTPYLEVKYDCILVASDDHENCKQNGVMELTEKRGFIASITNEETGCGGSNAPWLITAEPGQRINLTLFDFASEPQQENGPIFCHKYATLIENDRKREFVTCRGDRRVKHVYLSATNVLEVQTVAHGGKYFLLEYQVIGCFNLDTPKNGWLVRNGDRAQFGCNMSDTTWQMHCVHDTWIGHMETCPEDVQEYCEHDIFEASCPVNHVVVMQSALYGRMSQSKCLSQDYGLIGCSSDVLTMMDRMCSGRWKCTVSNFERMFANLTSCPSSLSQFLGAQYNCIPVASAIKEYCQQSSYIKLTDKHGYIANIVKEETGCGGLDAPWVITAEPGQRINLTLFDFGLQTQHEASTSSELNICLVYAVIKDRAAHTSTTICRGQRRIKHMYFSTSNVLEVRIITSGRTHFLLEYQVTGCPNPDTPVNGWVNLVGDRAHFGCNMSDKTWEMSCEDGRWTGMMETCTVGGTK